MFWLLPWDEDVQSRTIPWATWSLVALNVLAFLAVFLGVAAVLVAIGRRRNQIQETSRQ
jgi:hypothetical protein